MNKKFYIFPSELKVIASEASKYNDCETGGDLWGLWTSNGNPVVYLVTAPGAKAVGKRLEYEMDVAFMKECEDFLLSNYGLTYLGDWHSHHNLGLHQPSAGDQQRIRSLCNNNGIPSMAEIIVTHVPDGRTNLERISSYIYKSGFMNSSDVETLETDISPIRQQLTYSSNGKRIVKNTNTSFPLNRILLNQINKGVVGGHTYITNSTMNNPAELSKHQGIHTQFHLQDNQNTSFAKECSSLGQQGLAGEDSRESSVSQSAMDVNSKIKTIKIDL